MTHCSKSVMSCAKANYQRAKETSPDPNQRILWVTVKNMVSVVSGYSGNIIRGKQFSGWDGILPSSPNHWHYCQEAFMIQDSLPLAGPYFSGRTKCKWECDQKCLLSLENIATFVVKTAAQQRSLEFLARVAWLEDNPQLSFSWARMCLSVSNPTCCTWINTSWDVDSQGYKSTLAAPSHLVFKK